jgi:hypothetical protein
VALINFGIQFLIPLFQAGDLLILSAPYRHVQDDPEHGHCHAHHSPPDLILKL